MTDINVFVRPSRRNAEREAVGLARMRKQVKAGKLEVAWMSEEEKAAYRLLEPARGETTERKVPLSGCAPRRIGLTASAVSRFYASVWARWR